MTNLLDRLRGIYRIPITDGLGAVGAGEEPDNPNEFVRQFEPSPINLEAAAEIERLRDALERIATFDGSFPLSTMRGIATEALRRAVGE